MPGPLAGLKVVEIEAKGPGPFAAMVLSDLGAEVVTVGRSQDVIDPEQLATLDATTRMMHGIRAKDTVARGRRCIAVDLKNPDGQELVLRLIEQADVVIEGFRPGVAERLGVGPEACLERNPRVVYGRMTGWGQDGPLAGKAGHDLNYLAISGVLDRLRGSNGGKPMPPLNLLGDYGGGGMILVVGVLAALVERAVSGRGQVVDAAISDGVALLAAVIFGLRAEGLWGEVPGTNLLDLAAPFYNAYETSDGRYVTIGAGEPKFYGQLLNALGLEPELLADQGDESTWSATTARIAAVFRSKTFAQWREELEPLDVCFAPVLSFDEAPHHPHNIARETFVELDDGVIQPNAAPKFSRTPTSLTHAQVKMGADTTSVLTDCGFSAEEIAALLASGAARDASVSR
jgi:alpha-methylacyl-CoA racemase